ncbi:MAG: L-serine ammonia-lyase, iron-sulfur-dependent, subunit alpha [Bacillota bacterium]
MYNSGKDLLKLTSEKNARISDVVIEKECIYSDSTKEAVRKRMKNNLDVMKASAQHAIDNEVKSVGGIIGGDAKKMEAYRKTGKTVCGDVINKAMARAFSTSEVNASMGRICAAPTAGASGIIPAAILTVGEQLDASEDQLINALFTASGVGEIIAKNATLSGAEGGCQAECGAAAAMAAAAIVEMYGGTPDMALHAAAASLKNIMGLICDPIAGLVEAPCAKRNASGVVNAMLSADLALAGVQSIIPFDEVVEAMFKVGKALPHELRETALGGIATTETGIRIKKEIFGE